MNIRRITSLRSTLAAAPGILAAGLSLASSAAAQSTPPRPAQQDGDIVGPSDIVVTGSRVARDGAAAPTPVTVIGADYLAARVTVNIADALNETPAFRPTSTPAATANSATTAGVNFVDLRGLGSNRTLLLVDGKRHVPTSIAGRVDLNLIPLLLIERADVVTGGVSAVYGSDAVAGVVNLIFKRDFTGIEGEAQYDVSQRGDAEGYRTALHAGQAFADGRLHVGVSGELFANNGIGSMYNRDWGRREYGLLTNPTPANGLATRIISANVRNATMTPYGLVTSGPLRGTQFDAAGNPLPFTYGSLVGSQYMVGGDGAGSNFFRDFWQLPKINRQLASLRVSFKATDDIELNSEFYYGRSYVFTQTVAPFDFGTLTIRRDNPYLPASVAAAMDAQGIASFGFGRFSLDVGPNTARNTTQSYRLVQSARGSLGDWKWDGYYQFGKADYVGRFEGVRNNSRYLDAITSVLSPTGAIVCQSALTDPSTACRPYDPFGDKASAEAKAYVTGNQYYHQITRQHVAAVNLSGTVADLWAGPLAVSVGGEYRSEFADATSDALSQSNAFAAGNQKPIRGSYDVKEANVELELPLLRDVALAREVNLNAAVRYADYSTSGGAVAWKVGATWEVLDGLRLRFTRSRDVRAPNIGELFASSVTRITGVTDPQNGDASIFVPEVTSGNAALRPEKSDTLTGGITYTPGRIPGLRFSADYYNIDIKDAISSLTAQNVLDQCSAGATELCDLVVRTGGAVSQINIRQVNVANFKTNGVDVEFSYRTGLAGGTLTWRNLVNYVRHFSLDNGVTILELANQYNGAGVPRWSGNTNLSYARSRVNATLTGRFLGSAKFDNLFVEGVGINDNSVSGRFYLSLGMQYDLVEKGGGHGTIQLFGVVNNLLDVDPSVAPQNTSITNPVYFDTVGRAFRVGMRFRL